MAKAISPATMPELPEGMTGWIRSSRVGSMFHAHVIGFSACGAIRFDRFKSQEMRDLSDMQYWGVCPRCMAKALAAQQPSSDIFRGRK
jgi:hypothetical protein